VRSEQLIFVFGRDSFFFSSQDFAMTLQQQVDQKLRKERAEEAKQDQLNKMLWENKILSGHGKSETKVEKMRNARIKNEMDTEIARNYDHIHKMQAARAKEVTLRMEENLANELEKRNAKKIREDAQHRRICQSSQELRALKGKIAEARMNQSRAIQKIEAQRRAEEERAAEIDAFQKNEALEQAADIKEQQLRLDRCVAVMKEQQSQIQEKESRKLEARRVALEEKAAVEEIVQRIALEDEEEANRLLERQERTRKELADFVVRQNELRIEKAAKEQKELDDIETYARNKREREAKLEEEKQAKEAEKKRILNAMLGLAEAKNKEAEELDFYRNELHFEAEMARLKARELAEQQKKANDRLEMMEAFEEQMRIKEETRQREEAEEMEFRRKLFEKFAQDDKIEQMNVQRARLKVEQHKREVEKQVQERRQMYEADRQKELDELRRARAAEEDRLAIVEEERVAMLKSAVQDGLVQYMPKGVFTGPKDLELVEQFKKEMALAQQEG